PGLTAGGGLKRYAGPTENQASAVPPGLTAGGGLKLDPAFIPGGLVLCKVGQGCIFALDVLPGSE
ncbi:MAG: hypothetical protein WBX00_18100, partial [Isosphaeraceae bacterium]